MDSFNARVKRAFLYLCLIGVFALLVKIGLFLVADTQAEMKRGKTTYAYVTGKSISISGRHHQFTDRNVYFKYRIGKTVYHTDFPFDKEQYEATKIGSRFIITYLPETPQNYSIGIVTQTSLNAVTIFVSVILVFALIVFVVIVVTNENAVRSQIRIDKGTSKTYLNTVLSQRTAGNSSESDN